MPFLRCQSLRQRIHSLHLAAAITISAAIPTLSHAETKTEVVGTWKVAGILDSADLTSINERQAKNLLGHFVKIQKEGLHFNGEVCGPPSFEAKQVEPHFYLRKESDIGSSRLNLPNPVTVVDLSCTVVYIKSPNRLVFHWDGFFFDVVRVRPKVSK